jgi:hypothetical protein
MQDRRCAAVPVSGRIIKAGGDGSSCRLVSFFMEKNEKGGREGDGSEDGFRAGINSGVRRMRVAYLGSRPRQRPVARKPWGWYGSNGEEEVRQVAAASLPCFWWWVPFPFLLVIPHSL